jgi:molybdopterin/thiamine biosynthesis adenylyltransferase
MTLSGDELERYARHIVLREVGGAGQQALKAARVLVIGAGGLGSPAILYLAAAGVGTLRIVDDDEVSLSNLQRQVVHGTDDVGRPKVTSAAQTVRRINPHVAVEPIAERLTPENAARLLDGVTIALDGCDNFETRYLVADACASAQVPLITAALGRFDGSITTLKPYETGPDGRPRPSYRDLFPSAPPPGAIPACAEAGVLGALPGILGALMAMEAIKEIAKVGEGLAGRLLLVDALAMRFEEVEYG